VRVPELAFRTGTAADADWLIGLFDEAVFWLVARGQPGQWGEEPFSARDSARARVCELSSSGELRVASLNGEDVAALALGAHPDHVEPVKRPELYINLLLVSRTHAHRRIGEALVERALDEARERGVATVRVDCWAGAPSLMAWYEARGFVRSSRFTVNGDWTGQVFERPAVVTPSAVRR
jgi:GNAT superfamily N-acetyltransferase